jgi:hypothetical protein
MDYRSQGRLLIGLATAAGAFGAAALMSGANPPTARADDFTDVINAVEVDFTIGASDFNSAYSDFAANEPSAGLASFLDGVNDDVVSPTESLLIGTAELLDNESIAPPLTWNIAPEASFAGGLSQAEADFSSGVTDFSEASSLLSSAEYGDAVYYEILGADLVSLGSLDDLLLGSLGSL